MKRLSRKEKKTLIRIIVSLILFAAIFATDRAIDLDRVFLGNMGWIFPFALYFVVYIIIGYDVLWRAVRNIARGQIFDENFLMCLATLGAFALAIYRGVSGDKAEGFDEACAVLLFYQIGEWFQRYATGRSRKSISELMDIRPDRANVIRDGAVATVDPNEVKAGETILVNPGERIPLDGIVLKGTSSIDAKALTGESLPQDAAPGTEVISGCVNLTSQLEVEVEREFYDSTVSRILDLVENASDNKSATENFITKFARFYTPAVIAAALLLAIVPWAITGDFSVWIYRALEFLVVSCPCALVISIPLSFFCGIGAASKRGILVKGSDYLEKFCAADLFVFDKTGTLTKGNFALADISPSSDREEILRLAAIAERNSHHPIAAAIVEHYGKPTDDGYVLTDVAGKGVMAKKGDDVILCGNETLMTEYGIAFAQESGTGTAVYVAHNGKFIGSMLFADEVKPEAARVIGELEKTGCKTVMLTGDNETIAKSVAEKSGVGEFKASLLPQNKVSEIEKMLADKSDKSVLCFVGDGINDAPALMRSELGVAMGGLGSDAAIEAADIVLMRDDLGGLTLAKRIAKKTMRIVYENIIFSLAVKAAILVLSALGIASMWIAVFGDVGVAFIAILNAMRVNSRYEDKESRFVAKEKKAT